MGGFSFMHWVIVLVIVLLLFGAGRLSEIGKGLGQGIKEFKKGIKDEDADPKAKAKVVDAEEVEIEKPPKQLPAATKKKKIIAVEVDDDEDPEEIAKKIAAAKKKAVESEAEDETA